MIEPAERAKVGTEAGMFILPAACSAGWANYLISDPGACAPGFMLLRAPRALTPRLVINYIITLAKPRLGLSYIRPDESGSAS